MHWVAFLITMNLYIFFKSIIIYILKVMPNSAELKCAYNTIGYINSLLFQNCRKKCEFYRHFLLWQRSHLFAAEMQ